MTFALSLLDFLSLKEYVYIPKLQISIFNSFNINKLINLWCKFWCKKHHIRFLYKTALQLLSTICIYLVLLKS